MLNKIKAIQFKSVIMGRSILKGNNIKITLVFLVTGSNPEMNNVPWINKLSCGESCCSNKNRVIRKDERLGTDNNKQFDY
jgi:hypothetical protein